MGRTTTAWSVAEGEGTAVGATEIVAVGPTAVARATALWSDDEGGVVVDFALPDHPMTREAFETLVDAARHLYQLPPPASV